MKKFTAILLALVLALGLAGCFPSQADIGVIGGVDGPVSTIVGSIHDDGTADDVGLPEESPVSGPDGEAENVPLDVNGWYYSAQDVASYLYTYGCLPENFITKAEARELGWEGGNVEHYAPGRAIGGDTFLNREGLLPKAEGRIYHECDIDTNNRNSRGAKRLVFSNDGLIYYTEDHYQNFTLLYGEAEA